MKTSPRDSLLLIEHFQIGSQEHSVFFDSSSARKVGICEFNHFAINLPLIEETSEFREVFIHAETSSNHLGLQLNAGNEFGTLGMSPLASLAHCVSVLLL